MRSLEVGQLLLYQARDFAKESDAQRISLETAPDNTGAQRLYEKMDTSMTRSFSLT
ncbi:GNAT family N-acetyltransferase [Exiguobacterium sp. s22]|uniref:GNAT family N-acetyltransferase n=1 Tax=Exiguobacterium sp. s22 TaxID=2751272 RepID=UPI001BED0672